MKILDGKKLSEEIQSSLKDRVLRLTNEGIKPGIAVILIGDKIDSIKYVNAKNRACIALGIGFNLIEFPKDVFIDDVISEIESLNKDDKIHGIIVQLPIPKRLDSDKILNMVTQSKDVDGFNIINAGKLYLNQLKEFLPCTPLGCIELLEHYNIDIKGMDIVIIGCSRIVGLPLSMMLLQRGATVTICHIDTKNIKRHTINADMVISGCGVPHLVKDHWVKDGVIIIDIGINILNGKLVGDVDYENVKSKCSYITPVPGGVGPMTISMLIKQVIESIEKKYSKL